MSDQILTEQDGPNLRVTISAPERGKAVTGAMVGELNDVAGVARACAGVEAPRVAPTAAKEFLKSLPTCRSRARSTLPVTCMPPSTLPQTSG